MKVLVIDYVKLFQRIIATLFDDEGLIAVACNSRDEALRLLQQQHFAFICISMHLQDGNGVELCRQIRTLESYRYVPIILFTSETSSELQHQALSAGITDIFQKQADLTELTAYIKRFTLQYQPLNGHVLYIEDNKALRLTTLKLLRDKGLSVDSFTTAEQAWRAFNSKRYDLVITDIVLAGKMSGISLVNKIRRLNDSRGDVSILAMSGFDDISRRIELFHLGVNDYVIKPIVADEFLSRIRYLVGASRAVSHQVNMISDMFDQSHDAILVLNHRHEIIDANSAAGELTGYAAAELLNQPLQQLFAAPFDGNMVPTSTLPYWSGEVKLRQKQGSTLPAHLILYTLKNSSGVMHQHITIMQDLRQQRAAEAQIEYLESHDALTGLFNRHSFDQHLQQLLQRDHSQITPVALLWFRLLHLEEVNHTLGYQTGDKILIRIANRIKNGIGSSGTVYRITGEEFATLHSRNIDPNWLQQQGAAILSTIEEPLYLEQERVHLSAICGISTYPDLARNQGELIAQAEAAMHYARSSHTQPVQLASPELSQAIQRRHQITTALSEAIEAEQLYLLYQPQFGLTEQQQPHIIGIEALVRWQHPQLGLISPDEFIPIAEERHLMVSLGEWIIEYALHDHRQILAHAGRPIRLSINISPLQLLQENFAKQFLATLTRHTIAPDLIEVEVTEGTFIEDAEQVILQLNQLRQQRVSVALDDFGTGYSSLAYLKNLPIDCLKIDRSFVEDLTSDRDNQAVVLSAIDLAKHFNLRIIAEGIELKEQAFYLQQHHCHEFQGYCFSRPIPLNELLPRLDPN
ncbi:EAL domain-containing protein [Ectothiorhodospiraceae bacterium BW-2]|nr:EAL domain-containing protein [Ectothiorhodospiraceae bacterium BW-2]